MFPTAQSALSHLHGSQDTIGATVAILNEEGKPTMQVQISHRLLASPDHGPNLSLDYDENRKAYTFRRDGEAGSQSFPSIKAAVADLSREIVTEARLTIRDSSGKPMFFATLGPGRTD